MCQPSRPEQDDGNSAKGTSETSESTAIVAIFADYDSCFDFYCMTDDEFQLCLRRFPQPYQGMIDRGKTMEVVDRYLDQITEGAAEVVLFSGSNRQFPDMEAGNAARNGNGLSRERLACLAADRGWRWNNAWLAHGGFESYSDWSYLQQEDRSESMRKMKLDMLNNNLQTLAGEYQDSDSHVDLRVYYFDDLMEYVKPGCMNFCKNLDRVGDGRIAVWFQSVLFDWIALHLEQRPRYLREMLPTSIPLQRTECFQTQRKLGLAGDSLSVASESTAARASDGSADEEEDD